ncbi:MAG: glycosyltransferase [Acidilobaceae archaeon]|nr:glycosyltransferase [Acidilobaceae archaeon]
MRPKITCFMVSRNLLSQGYPFVETIAQALPVCDEFLISDGLSTDGTYQVLEKIAQLNPKVKLYSEEWPREQSFARTLKVMTDRMLERCKGEYAFYVQANEVIHEKSWEYLRNIHEIWPEMWGFAVPYLMLFRNVAFGEEFRLRLVRNLGIYEAMGDAWTLKAKRSFLLKELLKGLVDPRKFVFFLARGLHSFYGYSRRIYTRSIPLLLPRPVYRYTFVHPRDFLKKLRERKEKWANDRDFMRMNDKLLEATQRALEAGDDEQATWEIVRTLKERRDRWEIFYYYPRNVAITEIEEHPRIMQDLLRNYREYVLREEALMAIKEAR